MINRIESDPSSSMSTRILDVDDLVAVIAAVGIDTFMDEMIEVLRTSIGAFDPSRIEHQIRSGFNYEHPGHGLVEWMPTMISGDVVSVKTVGYHPSNPTERGLPSVLATTALYDTTTGRLIAMCEATLLTAIRTGAASAVVTDAVTTPGPISLGIIGCGAQAVTQIHAISRVRTIDQLVVTDADPTVAGSLGARLPDGLPAPIVLDGDAFENAIADLDVICTCTSVPIGDGPVATFAHARSNLHVNAVGADFPGKSEIPLDLLRSSVVIPDVIEQCMIEGESQHLERHELGPSIVDVLSGAAPDLSGVRTVFDSTGWSYEDLLAAQLFIGHAATLGLGTDVSLQAVPVDPYDPYERVRITAAQRSTGSLTSVRETG